MPEYVMPIESHEAQMRFDELDAFTQGYVEAALWCGLSEDEELKYYGEINSAPFDDLAPETLAGMIEDCQDFQATAEEMLLERNDRRAGVDFWLTRNGHGVGFWDGGWPLHGDELTKLSKPYGSVDLYIGDDGLIHGT